MKNGKLRLKLLLSVLLLVMGLFLYTYSDAIVKTFFVNPDDYTKYNVVVEAIIEVSAFGYNGEMPVVGSGVLISKSGIIVTAGHVLNNAKQVRVITQDNLVYDCNDFWVSEGHDVGFIDLPGDVNDFIPLSDSNDINKGDWAIHVGNAGGIKDSILFIGKVVNPKIYRFFFDDSEACILLKMKVEGGCSGGGVYVNGFLVGIVTKKNGNLTVVLPSNLCCEELKKWHKGDEDDT